MIVRGKPGFLALFFVYHGSIIPRVIPQILLVALLSSVVVWVHLKFPSLFPQLNTASFGFIGIALSLYLGFRNNACYDRWWEGRRLWGQLLFEGRSLLRLGLSYGGGQSALHRHIVQCLMAFTDCLRDQLRNQDPMPKVRRWLSAADCATVDQAVNRPDRILQLIGEQIALEVSKGAIDSVTARNFEQRLVALSAVQAGCERIFTTPIPFAYMLLVHRVCYIYCFLLPFGLVADSGLATPLLTAIVAYAFFGLDELSCDLEQPFAINDNGLALNALTRTLERECLQTLGEHPLPPPVASHNYRLN
ncbi:bestrophin family ion channel [Microbulbifer thermotolerans]|uniref:bestrophin family protein n=1 Tax=Microbulbifer thermotolerans TaxID=252514 RepID=UPI00224B0183|nr:bestrophin family ion channel [Microbulbifer thermotolerans]MCX2804620.1 bestrophin family ion channel [Microbulbifer thermotolerans]MCX2842914.1 bestrophin family ion channel [Microbulbifer thermotolerans]